MLKPLLVTALFTALAAAPSTAKENPYDTFNKVLHPFIGLLAEDKAGERALAMTLRVQEATGAAPELAGAQAEIAVQYPDKLRVSAPLLGRRVTLCRRGETVWVSPGSAVRALLENPEIASRLPEPNREFKMKRFKLPLSSKQLVFLPALFQVRPGEPATLEGKTYESVDFKLMPELSRALKVDDWSGTVWVDQQTQPVGVAIVRAETQVVIRVDKLTFAKMLPPATWSPTPEEAGDVLIVPPARYDQLIRAMLGERGEAKPAKPTR